MIIVQANGPSIPTRRHLANRIALDRVRVPRIGLRTRLTAAALLAATVGTAPALAAEPASTKQDADHAFDEGRFTEALAAYESLAQQGDGTAARRAGELLLYGHGLLATDLPCAVPRAAAWLVAAAATGDEDARQMWAQASGLPDATVADEADIR